MIQNDPKNSELYYNLLYSYLFLNIVHISDNCNYKYNSVRIEKSTPYLIILTQRNNIVWITFTTILSTDVW